MRDVEAGDTAVVVVVIGILHRLAFHAIPARGADVDRLRPGIRRLEGETARVALAEVKL